MVEMTTSYHDLDLGLDTEAKDEFHVPETEAMNHKADRAQ